MPPSVKKRTPETFKRHIDELTRLRTGIILDDQLPVATRAAFFKHIDGLVELLAPLTRPQEPPSSTHLRAAK